MRSCRLFAILGAMLLACGVLVAGSQSSLVTVARFEPPNLPEGVAVDRQGNIYLSMAPTGELRRIAPDGQHSTLATFRTGEGFLLGLTTDATGSVYAVLASGDAPNADTQGVWRVRPNGMKELVGALPGGFPNDPTLDASGTLFVTDSGLGAIWRITPDGPPTRWLEHRLLQGHGEATGPVCPAVMAPFPVGANGIAVAPNGDLIVAVTDFGRIVRVPVLPTGSAGVPQVVVEDCAVLGGVDGIAVDQGGTVYVAVNALNTIVRLEPSGVMTVLATAAQGLDNPATLAFGVGAEADSLYITNFAIFAFLSGGTPQPGLLKLQLPVSQPKPSPKKG